MFWRGTALNLTRRRVLSPEPPPTLCRHCGSSRLKLSYRRLDAAPRDDDPDATRTTFILRCAGCEGFTTVTSSD